MSEQSSIGNRQSAIPQGFTLLEVVLAIGLLGILVAAALDVLAVGLRSAQTSANYTQAVMLARRTLEDVALQPLTPGASGGVVEGGYRWSADVALERSDREGLPAQLFRVTARVAWAGRSGDKAVELVTLRAAFADGSVGAEPASPGVSQRRPGAPRSRQ